MSPFILFFIKIVFGSSAIIVQFHNNIPFDLTLLWKRDEGFNSIGNVPSGTLFQIDTYPTHEFTFLFPDNSTKGSYIASTVDEEIELNMQNNEIVLSPYHIETDDNRKAHSDVRDELNRKKLQIHVTDEFKIAVKLALQQCGKVNKDEPSFQCFSETMFRLFHKQEENYKEQQQQFSTMTNKLRNYTCADVDMETSIPIKTSEDIIRGKSVVVHTYLQHEDAKIWVVPNFISDEECAVLMDHGKPRLQRATVAGEGGEAQVSTHRQAQQAGYDVRGEEDPLWDLYSRVFNFTNKYNPTYNLELDGQEGFTIIQYNPNDQYMPHCDGQCDGKKHISKGRIATVVLYCKAPIIGGATAFTKADIFVKPVKNQATFFSYLSDEGITDIGYTEHSGCPVKEGEKWITTVWMRKGVSLEEPSTMYDPTGSHKL